ncbi:caspase family protein [Tahibacter harae]|uniref:Caspase family protein n=1 Tax=Tahibacter harae TaxID=2963937 RepID=A0ABT1QSP1_9GAMM|nr:caspase family protein [Tahibacter harae]MCQ4165282.1 caspase family protein [Tahibacter harae]
MSLIFEQVQPAAGTHVLAIGVGRYPHLLGGDGRLAARPLGLKQLQSPPVSLQHFLRWCFAPADAAAGSGFSNAGAPLASVEALVSSAQPLLLDTPGGAQQVDTATRDNIQDAFERWLQRLRSHADNIGVFYFCGHGIQVSDHYLLAEDFGRHAGLPWLNAFDFSNTVRAVEREIAGSVFYFIDACREISRDVAMTLGADPHALLAADLSRKLSRQSQTVILATGEGELAFAPQGGQVSRFTAALVGALSGYCGIREAGSASWNVSGENLATAVRSLLEFEALLSPGRPQVSEQQVSGTAVPLLRLNRVPQVRVMLDLAPQQYRPRYELYLESLKGGRVAQSLLDQVFRVDLPRGFYDVGALDPSGVLPALLHAEEELMPPAYALTLRCEP